ncbi:hypothetical protein INT43_000431 [Umbelopsis isabellina]|uniref:Uncharacterized protein n=1 Tax=Mortierella isabellina TaxID=91625 RepID=A0A8H7UJY9_MORIS|nr:hypothetical protein INT43_000431 [Umbelopsis isabellina]
MPQPAAELSRNQLHAQLSPNVSVTEFHASLLFMRWQLNQKPHTETPELAKKQAEKIRNEEKNKEQRPSPLSEEAKKKFEEINSKNAKK